MHHKFSNDISIVLCGEAGQGIQTVESLLINIIKQNGIHVYSTKEIMSRIRGGHNSTQLILSDTGTRCYLQKIDILIPLNKGSINHLRERISENTLIIGNKQEFENELNGINSDFIGIKFHKLAAELGNTLYANIIATGVITGIFNLKNYITTNYINKFFQGKSGSIIAGNIKAVEKGVAIGQKILNENGIEIALKTRDTIRKDIILSGVDAVSLGAIAGGCNFISSYPMSPSTGILKFFSNHTKEFNLIAEQVEDEISAINMALGASYSGARSMITTSGGGLALMQEGVSLAGITETPVVLHIGQRPGPATGLPTRTEQGDLLFSLFCGHGDFPRIIFAPGTFDDAFYLTQKAFNLADKFQIPVFVLTDAYFLESFYNNQLFNLDSLQNENFTMKTEADYQRYKITDSGISPRGIPGYGSGIVRVDSDEHDEDGFITESMEIRKSMMDKRMKKLSAIRDKAEEPLLIGSQDYKFLIIGWGTTFHTIKNAIETINDKDIAFLFFRQVFPLHNAVIDFLTKAIKVFIIENNAGAHFASVIKMETGFDIETSFLKYNGMPFSLEEVIDWIKKEIK